MIREIKSDDKIDFIKMCMDFYNTDGVDHSIPVSNMEKTFNLLMEGLDFAKAYVCEKNNKTAGYILLAPIFDSVISKRKRAALSLYLSITKSISSEPIP